MVETLMQQAESLFNRLERASKFSSRYNAYPHEEAKGILQGMLQIESSLPTIDNPQTEEQLYSSELKRRLSRESMLLENYLQGSARTYDFVLKVFGILPEDIAGVHPWLEQNKARTIEATERLFQTKEVNTYDLSLPLDIPRVRRQAEEVGINVVERYHKSIGRLVQKITSVGHFLRDIDAVPTLEPRSYYHPVTKTLALSIPRFLYLSEDSNILCRERELIRLYGHEGMGHALHDVVTKSSALPPFLKRNSGTPIGATAESIAQYYQRVIFEDLYESTETQRELGFHHYFPTIYQEAKDSELLHRYFQGTLSYAITVLANQTLGDPQDKGTITKKIDLINEISVNPHFARGFVEGHKPNFDSEGNLTSELVAELRYAAQPVHQVLKEFEQKGIIYQGTSRDLVDKVLLTGFWTPQGLVERARLVAAGKISM